MGLVIESGFWFIESGVSIHPVELAVYQHPTIWHPASVSILPDCVIISILVSSLLVVVHPVVHSSQVLVVHYSYWFAVVVSRRPKPVARRSLWSRQLSRQCVADPWWWFLADNIRVAEDMKFDDGRCRFTRDMSVLILSWFSPIANLSGLSICQFVGEIVFTYIWNQMKFKDKIMIKKK